MVVASRDGRVELWWVGLDGELGGGANKVEGQCQELEDHYRPVHVYSANIM